MSYQTDGTGKVLTEALGEVAGRVDVMRNAHGAPRYVVVEALSGRRWVIPWSHVLAIVLTEPDEDPLIRAARPTEPALD